MARTSEELVAELIGSVPENIAVHEMRRDYLSPFPTDSGLACALVAVAAGINELMAQRALVEGIIYTSVNNSPKQETWRDRPAML